MQQAVSDASLKLWDNFYTSPCGEVVTIANYFKKNKNSVSDQYMT